jgi:phosphoglycerate dehydrogenase-like enzyme
MIVSRGTDDDSILSVARDADFILVDAISPITAHLIQNMPQLKIIQSEGVAFDRIDLEAARGASVYVCNNQGVNADAVAEQTVLLMLACLRKFVEGDAAVRAGQQIQMKERMMVEGIRELGDCRIGFVGFGDIARATARRLQSWNCSMVYNKRTPLSAEQEDEFSVRYETLDELAANCDIVSLHVPVTESTCNMVDARFLARMKPSSYLINTARGEIVDQQALADALVDGTIAGAGLDTLSPEPVPIGHVLTSLPEQAAANIVLSPHIGGVTEGMFHRAHLAAWKNFARVAAGEEPLCRIC